MSEHATPPIEEVTLTENPAVEKCLTLVKDYWQDKLSKTNAILSIIQAITEFGNITEQDQWEAATGSYITQLDQHNAFKSLTAQWGSGRSESHSRTFNEREEVEQEEEEMERISPKNLKLCLQKPPALPQNVLLMKPFICGLPQKLSQGPHCQIASNSHRNSSSTTPQTLSRPNGPSLVPSLSCPVRKICQPQHCFLQFPLHSHWQPHHWVLQRVWASLRSCQAF